MTDDRATVVRQHGLATGIFRFVVALAFFGLLYLVFNEFVPGLIDGSLVPLGAGGNSDLANMQSYLSAAWTFLPAIVLFILATRMIARAAFESRGGVR
jgi:hypothetical protein